MEAQVTDDASHVLHVAAEFLSSRPAEHNLLLTLLTMNGNLQDWTQ